jgi:hypothetical protein
VKLSGVICQTFRAWLSLCSAALLLCACGAPGELATPVQLAAPTQLLASGVTPDAAAGDLLYVGTTAGHVFVLTYPAGALVATFSVEPVASMWGMCSDRHGDVFITDDDSSKAYVFEYAHGGTKPIVTLDDGAYVPSGCSVDPVTGDLAVSNHNPPSGTGNVAIYAHARGTPKLYADSKMSVAYCGYDDAGNLFVDGTGDYQLAELAKGATRMRNLRFATHIELPGGVIWDGQDLAVEDSGFAPRLAVVDRISIAGSHAKLTASIHMGGLANNGETFWIGGGKIVTRGGAYLDKVGIWRYPAGGHVAKILHGFGAMGQTLFGITVSAAH